MDAQRPASRSLSVAALAFFAVLTPLQLSWIPFFAYAWGFNLWQYLPAGIGATCALVALALCNARVRALVQAGFGQLARRLEPVPLPVFAVAAVVVFALLRAQGLQGDSGLLLLQTREAWFYFPETGGTFLMWAGVELARLADFPGPSGAQLLSCLCGGLALLVGLPLARALVPGPRRKLAPLVVALLASGGLARIFAGHVEVYATLLVGVIAYLWLALEYLAGRRPWWVPSLAFGVAVWIHAAALVLAPSLLLLPWLAQHEEGTRVARLRTAAASLALAAAPVLSFLAVMVLLGRRDELEHAIGLGLNILGIRDDPDLMHAWVKPFGTASVGTDVSFLSWQQLKYLLNASYVLLPIALPGTLWIGLRAPRGALRTPAARFLLACCVPLLLYAMVLRPFWGPWDWDLFSVGLLCLGCLICHVLAGCLAEETFRELAVVAIGFQALFVGLPFLLMGVMALNDAGPFAPEYFDYRLHLQGQPASAKLAPWL